MLVSIIKFFVNLADVYGLYGVGIGMALESLGLPFGGIAMALATVPLIREGRASYISIVVVATVGTTIGSVLSYCIGYFFGEVIRRFHQGHLINREDILNKFVDRYGEGAVFFAQLFGVSRSFISLPAGVVKMRIKPFLIGTIAGSLVINIVMVIANLYLYKTWEEVSDILGVPMWFSLIISILFVLGVIYLYKKKIRDFIKDLNGKLNGNNEDRKMQESQREI